MARKTTTSTEVKTRWNKKTYNRYSISLRKDEDKNLIKYIESEKEKGNSPTVTIKSALEKIIED